MPRIFLFQGFAIYFWTGENGGPVHVHVSKGCPSPSATKIWLTKNGGCILAGNGSGLNRKELANVLDFVMLNHVEICRRWKEYFHDDISFYR